MRRNKLYYQNRINKISAKSESKHINNSKLIKKLKRQMEKAED